MADLVTVGSLFSGGGGLDLAVERLLPGSSVVWCAETDPHALEVYQRRWPVPNIGDLREVDWTRVEPVDVLIGGYPCQPWSTAGRRKGQDDDRDGWPWFRDAVRHLGPQLVLLENVRGHVVPAGAGRTVGDLSDLGYDAVWTTLRASDVGAPHRRERWFCAAYPAGDGRAEGRAGTGERPGRAGQPAGHRGAATDPERLGCERRRKGRHLASESGATQGEARQRQRGGDAAHDRGATPSDPDRDGLPQLGRLDPAGRDADGRGRAWQGSWGDYEPAIRRWEHVLGRPAPAPVDERGRLSPPFVEWMMGWPEGHVTGLPRTAALRVLGNGVVPDQAHAAYAHLLDEVARRQEVAA